MTTLTKKRISVNIVVSEELVFDDGIGASMDHAWHSYEIEDVEMALKHFEQLKKLAQTLETLPHLSA